MNKNTMMWAVTFLPAAVLTGCVVTHTAGSGDAAGPSTQQQESQRAEQADQAAPALESFTQDVPTSTTPIEMIAMAGGSVTLQTDDGPKSVEIKPFWMSKTEIPWEVYDVFVFAKDEEAGAAPGDADAYTRPSRPYVPPDLGYGHEGYATISVAHRGAAEFCKWLSAMTGKHFRLATEAQWQLAAERSGITRDNAGHYAWTDENAEGVPHPVGTKEADASGLCDLWGNVREWVMTGEGTYTAAGGSFMDTLDDVGTTARKAFQRDWQVTDPQIPKSTWWLSDAPFMGFRIVCEPAANAAD